MREGEVLMTAQFSGVCLCVFTLLSCSLSAPGNESGQRKTGSASAHSTAKTSIQNERAVAERLLGALIRRDERELARFASDDRLYFQDGKLIAHVYEFLYGPNSVPFLIDQGGADSVGFKIVPQSDGSITILYVKAGDLSRLEDEEFLAEEWMDKYVACELTKLSSGEYVFRESLCFAETDGPYSKEYG